LKFKVQRRELSSFKSFEEIEGWKKSRYLVRKVYEITGRGSFAKDFGLRDQIRRASVSAMSNIAEGFERVGTKEFIQFLSLAKGSAGEVRSQLYVALDQGFLGQSQFEELCSLVSEVSRLTSGLITYLKKAGMKGSKFK
jgi:four helix bundle protein